MSLYYTSMHHLYQDNNHDHIRCCMNHYYHKQSYRVLHQDNNVFHYKHNHHCMPNYNQMKYYKSDMHQQLWSNMFASSTRLPYHKSGNPLNYIVWSHSYTHHSYRNYCMK